MLIKSDTYSSTYQQQFSICGQNTDKGNIFCRGPTIDSIYLFSAMLKYNSKFHSQKLK